MRASTGAMAALLLCASSLGATAADKDGAFAAKGVGRDSCKVLNEVYEKKSDEIFLVASWLDGYVTSVNTFSNNLYDLTPWQSTDLLLYVLVEFCEDNPEVVLAEAAQWLVQFVSAQALQEKSPLVETKVDETTVRIHRTVLRRVQEGLIKSGHLAGGADGAYGPKTRAALEAFQTANNLPTTGLPDQPTLFKMFIEQAPRPGAG
jgi:hypothetical protein